MIPSNHLRTMASLRLIVQIFGVLCQCALLHDSRVGGEVGAGEKAFSVADLLLEFVHRGMVFFWAFWGGFLCIRRREFAFLGRHFVLKVLVESRLEKACMSWRREKIVGDIIGPNPRSYLYLSICYQSIYQST